jgi:hypothetical protein
MHNGNTYTVIVRPKTFLNGMSKEPLVRLSGFYIQPWGSYARYFFINKLEKSVSRLAYVYPINASHAEARIYTAFML